MNQGIVILQQKKDIIENEYNLNIPRYIEVVEEDIAHDVDAHLYGGIPLSQIKKTNCAKRDDERCFI